MNVNLKKIPRGAVIAVAVSGGADSMALLHYLTENAGVLGYEVCAVNVEHGIRGEASVKDSAFVQDYCMSKGIKLYAFCINAAEYASEHKLSLEQSARKLRYECFGKLLSEKRCDFIATAHHLSDNAETILINLFRGTSLKGAAGIRAENNAVIRPLLGTEKSEILRYIEQNNIPYVTDETNYDDGITRNFIRLNVIPMIKKVFPTAERNLARFGAAEAEEDAYLDNISAKLLSETDGNVKITLPAERVLLLRAAVTAMKRMGINKDYEKVHAESVWDLTSSENGARVDLPCGVVAAREYDGIVFFRPVRAIDAQFAFAVGEYSFADGILIVSAAAQPDVRAENCWFIDAEKLPEGAVIRTRREGDMFTKFGGGTKKLKDYYIDKKVPLRLRDSLPVIANGNDVLFAGMEISDKIKIDKTTVNVLKLKYVKTKENPYA